MTPSLSRLPRRQFHAEIAVALAAAAGLSSPASTAQTTSKPASGAADEPLHDMSGFPSDWTRKEQVVMLLYPDFTALDLVGPQYMFGSLMGAKVHLVAKTMEPVMSDTKMAIMPTMTLDQCLAQVPEFDIFSVPGGTSGTLAVLKDQQMMDFVRESGRRAKLITSVCTGSVILAGAGLLKGYCATSHWVTRDLLPLAGAIAVNERVVVDRNRITGAGVTAGIDMGLLVTEKLRDRRYAQTVQLIAEYAPAPHLNAGTLETAPPLVAQTTQRMFSGLTKQMGNTLAQLQKEPS
jgi:cyclohexyl-isocyanide hydratase